MLEQENIMKYTDLTRVCLPEAGDTPTAWSRSFTSSSIKTSFLFWLASKFTIVKFFANQNRKEVFIELEVKDRDHAVGVSPAYMIQGMYIFV